MSLIQKIADPAIQQEYYEHFMKRADPALNKTAAFDEFWHSETMPQMVQSVLDGTFQLAVPEQIMLATGRECYIYPKEQAYILAFMAYVLMELLDNDPICVYSAGHGGVCSFFQHHMEACKVPGSVVVRSDIRKFTKSVRRDVFIEVQRERLKDDPETFRVVEYLFSQGSYTVKGQTFTTERNIFMGTAMDGFMMNAIFSHIDHMMRERCLNYARFYDDIAMVVRNRQEAEETLEILQQEVQKLQLELHPTKTFINEGDEPYELLGMVVSGTDVALSKKTREAFLAPVRQQCRQAMKMVRAGKVPGNLALAKAIQEINFYIDLPRLQKQYNPLLDCITGPESVRVLDHAIQDWLRAVASGTTSNAKYRVSFEQLKAAGYRSIVSLFYQRHAH